MSAQSVTILSGIVLLLVFVLVAWNLRRHRTRDEEAERKRAGHEPR
jgi:heme/copper-type cytochrome/quinol oxidase subunit 2